MISAISLAVDPCGQSKNELSAAEIRGNMGVARGDLFLFLMYFCWSSKIENFAYTYRFVTLPHIFWPCQWSLAVRLRHITWFVQRFCRRMILSPGPFGQFMAKIVFITLVSKTLNSFGPTVFFPKELLLSLSIRVVKSKNEFAAAEIRSNIGAVHVTEILRT